jgi:prepilin-type N-terminal cleavage/methylation domain-containing protein
MDKARKHQQGFTLIEIIAVIVLLGVLAAVVVPKYTNLTEEARNQAAAAAIAEGMARVNAAAAHHILTSGSVPAYADISAALDTDAGDYTLSYAAAGVTGVAITAEGPESAETVGTAGLPIP